MKCRWADDAGVLGLPHPEEPELLRLSARDAAPAVADDLAHAPRRPGGIVNAILALDLGTRTGYAIRENGRVESGVQVFDVKRGESPGMRYLRFNRWLDDVCRAGLDAVFGRDGLAVGLIVYEQTHHRGGAATEVAAGF